MGKTQSKTYIIIGAGIAGTNAAMAIRKEDTQGRIILVGDEPYPVYSRVNISKIVSKELDSTALLLKTPEQLAAQSIERITGKVQSIDRLSRQVVLED